MRVPKLSFSGPQAQAAPRNSSNCLPERLGRSFSRNLGNLLFFFLALEISVFRLRGNVIFPRFSSKRLLATRVKT